MTLKEKQLEFIIDTLHTQGKSYIVDSLLEYIYYRDPQWLPENYQPFQIPMKKGDKSC